MKVFASTSNDTPPAYEGDPSVSHVATFQYEVRLEKDSSIGRSSFSRKYGSMKRKSLKVDIHLEIEGNILNVSGSHAEGIVFTTRVP